jgi:methyltransferase (TIGR00027 family)
MTDPLIESVSDTAFWIAHFRAVETQRADALFRDPLAGVLAGDRGEKIARAMPMPQVTGWSVAIRTCIIDDYIRRALEQGVDTILNLGAGPDTRPYRMDLPASLLWVEADYPRVIEFKEARLSGEKPRCQLERVKINLADLPERRRMLTQIDVRAKKMLVLTEGVLPYLTNEEVGSLADDLRTLDRGRQWIAEYFSPALRNLRFRRRMRRKMKNAPFKFAPPGWFGFFEEHGWHLKEIRYLGEEADRLHRPVELPLPLKIIMGIRGLFLSASQKVTLFKKSAGLAWLERGDADSQRGTLPNA